MTARDKLRQMVETRDTRAGVRFDTAVQILIVLSLVGFSLDTLPGLSDTWRRGLAAFEVVSVALFTLEYGLRLYVAKRRLGFVFSFYGLVDMVAIAPFYITTGLDLRMVRALRLLRLFKLFRYSKAINRFRRTFTLVKDELVLFGATSSIVLYLAAAGIYLFENEAQPEAFSSIFASLWWAVATLTTVGYGDVYPITTGGRIFTFVVLVVGLGIVAIPSGIIASAMTETREQESP